jgi:hypothetical protein
LNTTLLGDGGWVLATFTLDLPGTSSNFFTVHTPFTANVSRIPPQPYPAEAPWLASAAQKWISCDAVPGCLGKTSFSYAFSIVNNYATAVIHAFAGGLSAPVHLASSPAIAYAPAIATLPSRGHLGRTEVLSEMNVTWWAPLATPAFVKWGPSPTALTRSAPATAATYSRADMCGAPATTMGWVEPYFWHTATIAGLTPGSTAPVYYSFGSDAGGWSAPASFLPAPAPGAPTKMLLLADNGVTEPDGCQDHWDEPQASLTVQHMRDLINSGSGYEWSLIVHPGDVSYSTGMLAKWATYTARWAGVFDRVPYFVGQGNHERDMPKSGMEPSPFSTSTDSGGECGVVTNSIFPRSVEWRALQQGVVHVVMLNSELSVAVGSPQYQWLNDTLAAVDRAATPWSIVAFHRPLYFVESSGGTRDTNFAPLEPLFVQYGVDAVLVGHVHNAFVSCPLNESKCVDPGSGPVHVCIGNAGQGITPIGPQPPWVVFQKAAWGYSTLEANATHMNISLYGEGSAAELWYTAHLTR